MDCVEFTVNGKTYDLRLTTRNTVKLEQALGENPIGMFARVEQNILPTVQDICLVLYYSLQSRHRDDFKNMDNVYDLYDDYTADGGDLMSIIPVIVEVYKVSGIIPKESQSEKN